MQNKPTAVGILAALILLGGLVLLSPSLWAVHQASWAPAQLTQEVLAGESITVPISVTAERAALPNTVVEVSPELAGFVTVTPSEPGTIPRGRSAVLTLTVRPPRTMNPGRIQGALILHKRTPSGEVFSPPLLVSITVTWPSLKTNELTINYPPALTEQGGIIAQPLESTEDGVTSIELPIAMQGLPALNTFGFDLYPNASHEPLTSWFEENIDTTGELLAVGTYTSQTFSDGKTALIRTGDLPADYDGPLVTGYAYILSPKADFIASLTLSQDHYLANIGFTTQASRAALLQDIVANLQFDEEGGVQ